MQKGSKLILLRHGESEWNRQNFFTGWVDIPLSSRGVEEALNAGKRLCFIPFDAIFVSSLVRSQLTAMLAMSVHRGGKVPVLLHSTGNRQESWAKNHNPEASNMTIPTQICWQINERMYGKLQGRNKDEMRKKFGTEQVEKWRRSFDVAPPEGESLRKTAERAIPCFKDQIFPHVREGKNVLVSAHGNSLRAISMFLDHLSEEKVLKLEIPTGEPICYSFEESVWKRENVDEVQKFYREGM